MHEVKNPNGIRIEYDSIDFLSFRFELLKWASYLMREMNARKILINRDLLDEFLHLNFVNLLNIPKERIIRLMKKFKYSR
jgi:hypothetical protein